MAHSLDDAIALLQSWDRRGFKSPGDIGSARDLVEEFEKLCAQLKLATAQRSRFERLRLETEPGVSLSWTNQDDVLYFVRPVVGGERLFKLRFSETSSVTCLDRGGEILSGQPLEVLVDQVIRRLDRLRTKAPGSEQESVRRPAALPDGPKRGDLCKPT